MCKFVPQEKELFLKHLIMIRHIVMWKLKAEAEGKTKAENALIIKESLEALKGVAPTLVDIEVGLNDPETPESNYDVVLNCTFASVADLNDYQVHPAHQAAAVYIKKVVEERVCVDYQY